MMTCTSEISGSASSGTCRSDQIPASTSSSVPVKTRKRFLAHQSIQRVITSHASRRVHAQLPRGYGLSVLRRHNRYLPCAAAFELTGAFINSVAFIGEGYWGTHSCHAHRWHRRHEESHGYFCAQNRGAARLGKFHANGVVAFSWRSWFGGDFNVR